MQSSFGRAIFANDNDEYNFHAQKLMSTLDVDHVTRNNRRKHAQRYKQLYVTIQ